MYALESSWKHTCSKKHVLLQAPKSKRSCMLQKARALASCWKHTCSHAYTHKYTHACILKNTLMHATLHTYSRMHPQLLSCNLTRSLKHIYAYMRALFWLLSTHKHALLVEPGHARSCTRYAGISRGHVSPKIRVFIKKAEGSSPPGFLGQARLIRTALGTARCADRRGIWNAGNESRCVLCWEARDGANESHCVLS